jgi:hypothetical protein
MSNKKDARILFDELLDLLKRFVDAKQSEERNDELWLGH